MSIPLTRLTDHLLQRERRRDVGDRRAMKLQLGAVVKEFGAHRVLDGIDLDVDTGEVVALIGASGSGRARCCAASTCSSRSTTGVILLDGVDISEPGLDPDPIRRRIGMVFQSFNLFPHLTVARQRGARARARSAASRRGRHGEARRCCWPGSGWPTRRRRTPTSCRAASSSGWRSPGRWRWTPR